MPYVVEVKEATELEAYIEALAVPLVAVIPIGVNNRHFQVVSGSP